MRWWRCAGLAALTLVSLWALFGAAAPGLQVESSFDALVQHDPTLRRAQQQFGQSDVLVAAWTSSTPLTGEQLLAVAAAVQQLREHGLIASVDALTDAVVPAPAAGVATQGNTTRLVSVETLARDRTVDLAGLLGREPLLVGRLLSADGRTALAAITLGDPVTLESAQALRASVQAATDAAAGLDVRLTGAPVIQVAAERVLQAELLRFAWWAALAIVVVLLLLWRDLFVVIWAAASIALAGLWTLAAMSVLGVALNLVTAVALPLVVALGLAYAMHAVAEVQQSTPTVWADIARPLWLTGLTTALGLLALLASPMPAVRQFAVAGGLGVLASVLSVLWTLPLLCALRTPQAALPAALEHRLDQLAQWAGVFACRQRRLVGWAALVMVALAILGGLRVSPDSNLLSGLPVRDAVRDDFETVNAAMGGISRLSILVDAHTEGGLLVQPVVEALAELDARLQALPGVGARVSFLDYAGSLQQAIVPQQQGMLTGAALKQLLVFTAPRSLYDLVDPQFQTARIEISTAYTRTSDIRRLVESIRRATETLPGSLEAHVVGTGAELADTVDGLASGQLLSIALALISIFIVLALVFSSARAAAVAMIPNALPVLAYFGLIGWTGIALGPSTSLLSCIVLGIAVDDTLHYLLRFNEAARVQTQEARAARTALRRVIRPITLTTVALITVFLLLATASLEPLAQLGWLAAAVLLLAWVTDLLITPALSASARIVTLWDVLRLDLGAAPQQHIPLLQGLSNRQAKVFALMTEIRTVPQGAVLLREGDEGADVFLILDGEAVVSREEDSAEIARLGRGALIGEVGLFGQRRTANVTALRSTRLLRFEPAHLERLTRRSPRIAATVYRNLNAIQAQRRAPVVPVAAGQSG